MSELLIVVSCQAVDSKPLPPPFASHLPRRTDKRSTLKPFVSAAGRRCCRRSLKISVFTVASRFRRDPQSSGLCFFFKKRVCWLMWRLTATTPWGNIACLLVEGASLAFSSLSDRFPEKMAAHDSSKLGTYFTLFLYCISRYENFSKYRCQLLTFIST